MTLPLWPTGPGPGASPSRPAQPSGPAQRAGTVRAGGAEKAEPRRLTLVRLAGEVARSLAVIGRVAVEGEVHRPQTARSGWTFFTLKDRAAQLPVTVPARHARRCRAINGERVLVVGSLVWVNDRGQVVLEAEEVLPVGEGAVAAMIAETRARLAAEGVLARPRRPIPALPRLIGVLCGADAAVRRDIESVVAARFPGYPLAVEETTVSGPGAAVSIIEGLRRLGSRPGVEVVVLARGGGDATALLPWSDEDLCRAVALCPVPVVSAIGHESDRPLCDEVADLRCGTPSIAAHRVVPDRDALYAQVEGLLALVARDLGTRHHRAAERLGRAEVSGAMAAGTQRAADRLGHAQQRLAWSHPSAATGRARLRLEGCRWQEPVTAHLSSGYDRLEALGRHAASLSPRHVIERGFAVVRGPDGSVVRSPSQVTPGQRLSLSLAQGTLGAIVEDAGRGR